GLERALVPLDLRQLEMRVLVRVAVAWEVLGARADACSLQTADERRDVAGDERGIGTEGADADDRVVGVRVHVRDWSEVQSDAHRGEVGPDCRRHALGEVDVVDDPERVVPGVGAAGIELKPRHVAAFLVDSDHESGPRSTKGSGQRSRLLRIADVAREEADAAEPGVEPPLEPAGRLEPDESGQQAADGEPLDLRAHPRTAPAVRPKAILRCTSTKKTTTGSAASVAPAISGPQSDRK